MRRTFVRRFLVGRRDLATATVTVSNGTIASLPSSNASSTAVQLPPRVATRNVLKAAIDLGNRTIPNPEMLDDVVKQTVESLQQPRKPLIACK